MQRNSPWRPQRSALIAAIYLITLLIIGTIGFSLLSGSSLLDALYMTVTTITTVGYGEIVPLNAAGRIFAMLIILGGVGLVYYSLTALGAFLVLGDWQNRLRYRRRKHMIDHLKGHTIVCGYGRVGRHVVRELMREKMPYVIIEMDPEKAARLESQGHLVVSGNAADERRLQEAGIAHASHLIACASSDAENVFITLTAKGIRPDLHIVARANYEESIPKLMRAGADRVIEPYTISGRRMVSVITRPDVADFLDEVMHSEDLELWLEQIVVGEGSPLIGRPMSQSELSDAHGVVLLAYTDPATGKRMQPQSHKTFDRGMRLIVIGTEEKLHAFSELAHNRVHLRRRRRA